MSNQAAWGAAFLEQNKYPEAIEQYTLALAQHPNSPDYYIKRSIAHQRKTNPDYLAALQDAESAVVAATARSRRELIAEAQLRRGIALFQLGRFKDAEFVFSAVQKLNEKEKSLAIWQAKVAQKLNNLTGDEGPEATELNVKTTRTITLPQAQEPLKSATATTGIVVPQMAPAKSAPIQPTPADKIKHDWYQSSDKVYLTILAKGVPKDKAVIEILENSVYVMFPTADDKTYSFSLDPLFSKIDPSQSAFTITNHKVEVVLKKANGLNWNKLESEEEHSEPKEIPDNKDEATAVPPKETPKEKSNPPKPVAGPTYPTSSRSGPKNWDKLADEFDDGKEGGDDVNHFFQTLYKGADADTQRAMLKSYQESNGTVLSTNWSEVGAKKVETAPPDGMTAKKWDE